MGMFDSFSEDDKKPMNDFTPVPVDKYAMVATAYEWKNNGPQSKDPDGRQLVFTIEIVEGKYTGRKIWIRLNLENISNEAVQMSRREFAELARAVGKLNDAKSEGDLLNIPFIGDVGINPANKGFEASNKINHYLSYASVSSAPIAIKTAPVPAGNATSTTPPINPATGNPYKPWEDWPGK